MPAKKSSKKSAPKQYLHKKAKRPNNPHAGIASAKKEPSLKKTKYQFDPHLDPQLQWTGKDEQIELSVDSVPLHIHERIDPSTIIEKVLRATNQQTSIPFFESSENKLPLYKAIEFYQHQNNWSNRLIAGDSMIIMNSLLENESMSGKIQMAYVDPPYGKKYASNFQPFVCKQNDKDLSREAETIRAFRDTWELGIHSYLSYLRQRLLLVKKLLNETGSCFVQISIDNMHLVRTIMDEIFGAENFMSIITYRIRGSSRTERFPKISDYIVWYAKDISQVKFHSLFVHKDDTTYTGIELPNGDRRNMTKREMHDRRSRPKNSRVYRIASLVPAGKNLGPVFDVEMDGKVYSPGINKCWKTNKDGMNNLIKKKRVVPAGKSLGYIYYYEDYPVQELNNVWLDTQSAVDKNYVVETPEKVIRRCVLMTTEPGDLVFDPTCGAGTTAYVAEKFGRRWITCDTSRIAITLARQRLMTSSYDYYKLANAESSKNDIQCGFEYESVPHIKLEQLARNEREGRELLLDKPIIDKTKHRISGPFTVEAVPAPTVKSIDVLYYEHMKDEGMESPPLDNLEAQRMQQEWRNELLKTGIKGKNNQKIEFSALDVHPTTQYIHAIAETKETEPKRAAISFGPTHAPLNQHQIEIALQEAQTIHPKISMVVFAAMHFDPEASKNIAEIKWEGMTILKAEINKDLLTNDLKKSRLTNESFWLVGQPDVVLEKNNKKYFVRIQGFDYFDTEKNNVVSHDTSKIVLWMLDTDYDGRSVYPQQLFFPMKNSSGSKGLTKLAKTLRGEIDETLIERFFGVESLSFEAGLNKKIAVKIIDDQGIESLRILELK